MVQSQQKGQRVGVFVDVQNMYYSARFMYNCKVNFKEILKEAVKNRVLIRAIAYVIRTEDINKETFFEALEKFGYEVKAKDLQVFYGGSKKGDWDIGIAMDAIELAPKLDTVILVSGDGDFVPLAQHLKRALGCRVEVMAFGKSANATLKEEADLFTDFEQDKRRYLIEGNKNINRRIDQPIDTHSAGGNRNARTEQR
ncbi:NYN domain-containing protein [archaeon]|nr:NYN domain-containing protein [archaeon]